MPVPSEYAWGSIDYNTGSSILNAGTDSMRYANSGVDAGVKTSHTARVGCNALSTGSTRTTACATFYGAMDYGAHSVVIKMIFNSTFNFDGEHGDGLLSTEGYNNQNGWPEVPNAAYFSTVQAYPQSSNLCNTFSISANSDIYSTVSGSIIGCRRL